MCRSTCTPTATAQFTRKDQLDKYVQYRIRPSFYTLHPTNHTDFYVAPLEGSKAMTIWSAEQYGEQDSKGSLEPGKLADLVILDRNPLKVEPMAIKDIRVVETIKEGKTIYARP